MLPFSYFLQLIGIISFYFLINKIEYIEKKNKYVLQSFPKSLLSDGFLTCCPFSIIGSCDALYLSRLLPCLSLSLETTVASSLMVNRRFNGRCNRLLIFPSSLFFSTSLLPMDAFFFHTTNFNNDLPNHILVVVYHKQTALSLVGSFDVVISSLSSAMSLSPG